MDKSKCLTRVVIQALEGCSLDHRPLRRDWRSVSTLVRDGVFPSGGAGGSVVDATQRAVVCTRDPHRSWSGPQSSHRYPVPQIWPLAVTSWYITHSLLDGLVNFAFPGCQHEGPCPCHVFLGRLQNRPSQCLRGSPAPLRPLRSCRARARVNDVILLLGFSSAQFLRRQGTASERVVSAGCCVIARC